MILLFDMLIIAFDFGLDILGQEKDILFKITYCMAYSCDLAVMDCHGLSWMTFNDDWMD